MSKIGVLLAGCGAQDGAEIHEAVITLLALDRSGVETIIMAPDMDQFHVVDHLSGNTMEPARNILVESSRIARGDIVPVGTVSGDGLDGLIFPGGTGMSKNIFDYAMTGADCTVINDVEQLVSEMLEFGKPIGAICIAPVMVAKILQNMGRKGVLTGGKKNNQISTDMVSMGMMVKEVDPTEIVVDNENNIVSTPAYVEAKSIGAVAGGIEKLVNQVVDMAC